MMDTDKIDKYAQVSMYHYHDSLQSDCSHSHYHVMKDETATTQALSLRLIIILLV